MSKLVSVHLETVLASVQDRCTVCTKCTIGSEIILEATDGTLGEEAQVEAHFWHVEMMLFLTRDGCTVGTERTIGSENHFGRTRWNS